MLSEIFSTVASGFLGGITGLIGHAITSFMKYKTLKLQYEHEEKLKQLSMEEAKLKTDLQIKLAESKLKGDLAKLDSEIFKASYEYMKEPLFKESYFDKLPRWLQAFKGFIDTNIDALRASIRPVLTIWYTILGTWLGYAAYTADPKSFTASTKDIVNVILFLSTSITLWWFGNRDTMHHINEMLEKNIKLRPKGKGND